MKKLIAALLALALLGAFAACGKQPPDDNPPPETTTEPVTTTLTLEFTISIPTTVKKQAIPGDITEYLSGPVEQLADAMGCEYRDTTGFGLTQYANNSDAELATIDITEDGDSIEIGCSEPGYSVYGIAVGEPYAAGSVPAEYKAMQSFFPKELYMFARDAAFRDTLIIAVDEQGTVINFQIQIPR